MKTQHRTRVKKLPFFLALAVVCVVVYLYSRNTWPETVTRRLQELREQGIPITLHEVNQLHAGDIEGEIAARHYLHAFSRIQSGELPDLKASSGTGALPKRWSEEEAGEVERCLADNHEALELLHQGRQYASCRFPIHFPDGLEASLPHLPKVRLAAQLLALEAHHHARNNRSHEALRSLRACLHMAVLLEREPLVISQLFRNSIATIACVAVRDCLSFGILSSDDLQLISRDLRHFLTAGNLAPALDTERCLGLSFFRGRNKDIARFLNQGDPNFITIASVELIRVKGILQRDCANFLRTIDEFQQLAVRMPHERLKLLEQIDRGIQDNRTLAGKDATDINIISGMLLPGLVKLVERHTKTETFVQLALVGAAMEGYRVRTGNLPPDLDALIPEFISEIPTDPYTGEPILFSRTDQHYRVFSPGTEDSAFKWTPESSPSTNDQFLQFVIPLQGD